VRSDKFSINWSVALPLLVLLLGTVACSIFNLQHLQDSANNLLIASLVLSLYNFIVLAIAFLSSIDVPKTDKAVWFDLHQELEVKVAGMTLTGSTTALSETGAIFNLYQATLPPNEHLQPSLELKIVSQNLNLKGKIVEIKSRDRYPQIKVAFEGVTQRQHKQLIELLFCRPGQWKRQQTPGEFKVLFLLLRSLLKPRFLERNTQVSVMIKTFFIFGR